LLTSFSLLKVKRGEKKEGVSLAFLKAAIWHDCFSTFLLKQNNTALQASIFCEKAPTHPQVSPKEVEKLLDITTSENKQTTKVVKV